MDTIFNIRLNPSLQSHRSRRPRENWNLGTTVETVWGPDSFNSNNDAGNNSNNSRSNNSTTSSSSSATSSNQPTWLEDFRAAISK